MKKNSLFLVLITGLSVSACNQSTETETSADLQNNPLMEESTLPYSTPDFSKIKNEHFKPAFIEAMRQQTEAVNQITANEEEATFENTVLALEKSGVLLERVSNPFYALTGANTNEELQNIQEFLAPELSAHYDAIYLNEELFQRLKTLHGKRSELNLDQESLKLLENYYEDFEIAGANLSSSDKDKLKDINAEEATLITQFNQTLLAANNAGAIIINDKAELAGLSESEISALKDSNNWRIPLQNTTQQPLLQSLENRNLREKLFKSSWNRADGSKN